MKRPIDPWMRMTKNGGTQRKESGIGTVELKDALFIVSHRDELAFQTPFQDFLYQPEIKRTHILDFVDNHNVVLGRSRRSLRSIHGVQGF
jgi:hypothetical protein